MWKQFMCFFLSLGISPKKPSSNIRGISGIRRKTRVKTEVWVLAEFLTRSFPGAVFPPDFLSSYTNRTGLRILDLAPST